MALVKRHLWSIFAVLCSAAMASLAILYSHSDLELKYIAPALDAFAGFKAWLTAPILFLLMNGVVISLGFTSGFLRRQHSDYGEDPEDLVKTIRRENHDLAEEEAIQHEKKEEEANGKEEEDEDGFYPEVLSSFFGDGTTTARRKPMLQRSASAPSAERKNRFFYPSIGTRLSQKFGSGPSPSPGPIPIPSTNAPTAVSSQPLLKVLRPVHTVPKATYELKNPVAAIQTVNGNAEDKDVDQRADAFIGDFYKKMKLQQVDPYMERLERSYGR